MRYSNHETIVAGTTPAHEEEDEGDDAEDDDDDSEAGEHRRCPGTELARWNLSLNIFIHLLWIIHIHIL